MSGVRGQTRQLRPWASIAYFLLFALAGAIALMSADPQMRVVDIEAVLPGFYSHTSNLLLSYGLIVVYGLLRMLSGARLREIALVALLVAVANYVYEVFLTLWNTRDIVDAHYCAFASALTFALLAVIHRHGLRPPTTPDTGRAAPQAEPTR